MGAKESWIAVRDKETETVRQRLGKYPTGLRSHSPDHGFWQAGFPGGWTVIIEGGYSDLHEDDNLRTLSAGCELISGSVMENVGYSMLAGWRDGQHVWSITLDPDSEDVAVRGELPAGITVTEDTIDFETPMDLGEQLTGYRYLTYCDASPFELLASAGAAGLIQSLLPALRSAMTGLGYTESAPPHLISAGYVHFHAPGPLAGLVREVHASIMITGPDTVSLSGEAVLSCPELAALDWDETAWTDDRAASTPLSHPAAPARHSHVGDTRTVTAGQATEAVRWFTEIVKGPAADWHAKFGTATQLLTLARQQRRFSLRGRNVDGSLIRATALLCARHHNAAAAAELMRWYLRRRRFYSREAFESEQSFDRALADRIPAYAQARNG